MRGISVFAALVAASLTGAPALAKSLDQVSGPANLPPPSFKGRQFVDSTGCIFVRAGFGTNVNWIPRVQRNKTVLCGYTPTFGRGDAVAVAAAPTTAPPPVVAAPARVVAPPVAAAPARVVAPPPVAVATAPPRPVLRMPAAAAPVAVAPGAYVSPYMSAAARVPSTTYGPVVTYRVGAPAAPQCGAGFVTAGCVLAPAAPARVAVAAPSGATHTITAVRGMGITAGKPLKPRQAEGIARAVRHAELKNPPLPPGYVYGWSDGRLNPYRGPQTQEGDLQMAQIWTDEVPARLVAEKGVRPQVRVRMAAGTVSPRVRVSSSGAPEASGKPRYVQVGSFANPANAQAAIARVQAAGFPAAISRATIRGKSVQVVLAGPFAGGAAPSALSHLRGAGFGDAVLR